MEIFELYTCIYTLFSSRDCELKNENNDRTRTLRSRLSAIFSGASGDVASSGFIGDGVDLAPPELECRNSAAARLGL